jgi:O-antigen/teichoic acid export membrane protein
VFAGAVVSSTASLLERIVVGRYLSPSAYGEFSIAVATFTLGVTLATAGFIQGIPRFMAQFSDLRDIRGAWVTGAIISTVFSLIIATGLIVGSPIIVPRLFETAESSWLYYALVVSIPPYVGLRIGVAAIRGMENTKYKLLTQDLTYPLLKLAFIIVLLSKTSKLVSIGVAYFVAIFVALIITYVLLNRLFPLIGSFRLHGKEMVGFSLPLVISTMMSMLLTRIDTLMLGYFQPSQEVGIYNAAYPLALSLSIILRVFGYMYLPIASRLDSEDDGSVGRIYEISTKWIYILTFPPFTVLLLYPDEIISIAFGEEYIAGGIALSILGAGFFTNAAMGRNRETLSALGATKFVLFSNVIAFVMNIIMNLALIPRYGFIGAAVASASSYTGLNIVTYVFLKYYFSISPFNYSVAKTIISLPVFLIPTGYLIRSLLPKSVLGIVLFLGTISLLSLIILIPIQGLEHEDGIIVEFIEEQIGVTLPIIHRYIPEAKEEHL